MDPSQYMSKELNLYSYDGKKRLQMKEVAQGNFEIDFKNDLTGDVHCVLIKNQHLVVEDGSQKALLEVLTDIKQSVVDETGAREEVEEELRGEIGNHYDELDGKITAVNDSLGSYVVSLSNSISDVNTQLSTDRNNLEGADFALGVRIDTETSDRQQALSVVSQAVSDETTARINADNGILQSLTDEIGARTTAIEEVQLSVVNEGKLRAAADTVLQGQIITLMSGATSSTTEYKQLVLDEKKRAFDAEGLLSVAIADAKAEAEVALSNEATTRLAEDTKIIASVEAEAKRAVEEEGKLSARIDFVLHNTSAPALDSLSEIVNKFNTDGQGYADRLTYLEGIVTALVNR